MKKKNKGITRGLAYVLLFCYVAGTSQFDTLHDLVHHHDPAVMHSAEQEHDPCHRSIYHNDIDLGCEHDAHLIVSDKCHMCDLVSHGDQTWTENSSKQNRFFEHNFFSFYKENLDSYWAVIASSRAPPTLL